MSLLKVEWIHQPQTFQLESQKYTPDFYLPQLDLYIEIKNFLNDYSRNRDEEFRRVYPNLKLELILKKEYLLLEDQYADEIPMWEFSPRRKKEKPLNEE